MINFEMVGLLWNRSQMIQDSAAEDAIETEESYETDEAAEKTETDEVAETVDAAVEAPTDIAFSENDIEYLANLASFMATYDNYYFGKKTIELSQDDIEGIVRASKHDFMVFMRMCVYLSDQAEDNDYWKYYNYDVTSAGAYEARGVADFVSRFSNEVLGFNGLDMYWKVTKEEIIKAIDATGEEPYDLPRIKDECGELFFVYCSELHEIVVIDGAAGYMGVWLVNTEKIRLDNGNYRLTFESDEWCRDYANYRTYIEVAPADNSFGYMVVSIKCEKA